MQISNFTWRVFFLCGFALTAFDSVKAESTDSKAPWFAPMPEDMKYVQSDRELLNEKEIEEVTALTQSMRDAGFADLLENDSGLAAENFFELDQVYWNAENNQSILLKLDIAPEKEEHQKERFLTDKDSFVFHGKTFSGLPYAAYFVGFTAAQAKEALGEMQKAFSSAQKKSAYQKPSLEVLEQARKALEFFPEAQARPGDFARRKAAERRKEKMQQQSAGGAQGASLTNSTHKTQGASSSPNTASKKSNLASSPSQDEEPASEPVSYKTSTHAQKVLSCLKGTGQAIYDSTVGLATRAVKGAWKLVKATAWGLTHPKQAWQKSKQRVQDFTALMKTSSSYLAYDVGIGRTNDKLSGMRQGLNDVKNPSQAPKSEAPKKEVSAYNKLSPEQKARFVCQQVATVGIVGASWFFLPGNTAGLSAQVSAFLSGSAQVMNADLGRQFFMEMQFAEMNKRTQQKYKTLREDQIALSRKWARENPKEAAEIIRRYKTK